MADDNKCAYATYYTSGTSGEPGHHRCSCIAWGAKAAALIEAKDAEIEELQRQLAGKEAEVEMLETEIGKANTTLNEARVLVHKLGGEWPFYEDQET